MIKILIVDDNAEKVDAIERLLTQRTSEHDQIDVADSFIGGLKSLETVQYDLLVLDIVLPQRSSGVPKAEQGRNLLVEIIEGETCKKPAHIVCLTEFEEEATNMQEFVEACKVHVVLYQNDDGNWRSALENLVSYVVERIEEAVKYPDSFATDVAIITSSPSVELREVLRLPGDFKRQFHCFDEIEYFEGKWKAKSGKDLRIVACCAPDMGMVSAAVTATKLVNRWRPRYLVMTGIAAGTDSELSFGDVLVAGTGYDYGSGKIRDTADGKREFVPRPKQIGMDTSLEPILQRWVRDGTCMDEIRREWSNPSPTVPKLTYGVIASGAAVVQSENLVDEIIMTSGKTVGLEMEAYGVLYAGKYASEPKPRVLVAKAVSDFADRKKGDDYQAYAAFTSARFVYKLFCTEEHLF